MSDIIKHFHQFTELIWSLQIAITLQTSNSLIELSNYIQWTFTEFSNANLNYIYTFAFWYHDFFVYRFEEKHFKQ